MIHAAAPNAGGTVKGGAGAGHARRGTRAAAQQSGWRTAATCGLIFVLALVFRLNLLIQSYDGSWPHSVLYEGDAPTWVEYAAALGEGKAFEHGLPMRSPAVAHVLHWLKGVLSGAGWRDAKAAWCIWSALACPLLYLAARRSFGERVGVLAGVLYSCWFGSIVTATSLNNECLYTTVLMAIVLGTAALHGRFAHEGRRNARAGTGVQRLRGRSLTAAVMAVGVGVLHGMATVIRAEHALLVVMYLGVFHIEARRSENLVRARMCAGLMILACMATLLPGVLRGRAATRAFNDAVVSEPVYEGAQPRWTEDARAALDALPGFAREGNFRYLSHLAAKEGKAEVTSRDVARFFEERFGYTPEALREPMFVSSQGPLAFALANDVASKGLFSRDLLMRNPHTAEAMGTRETVLHFGFPPHNEIYNHGYRVGLRGIWEDPIGWVGLAGKKLMNFARGATAGFSAHNWPYGRRMIRNPVDMSVGDGPGARWIGVVIGLGLCAGIWRVVRLGGGALWLVMLGYKVIVTVLFFGYARQAAAIGPAFCVFGAVAAEWIWTAAAARNAWAKAAASFAGMTAVFTMVAVDVAYPPMKHAPAMTTTRMVPREDLGAGAFTTYEPLVIEMAQRGR